MCGYDKTGKWNWVSQGQVNKRRCKGQWHVCCWILTIKGNNLNSERLLPFMLLYVILKMKPSTLLTYIPLTRCPFLSILNNLPFNLTYA